MARALRRHRPLHPRPPAEVRKIYEDVTETGQEAAEAGEGGSVGTTRRVRKVWENTNHAFITDYVVRCMDGSCTVYLPDATRKPGKRLHIECAVGGSPAINVTPAMGQTLNGSTSPTVISTAYGSLTVRAVDGNWIVE